MQSVLSTLDDLRVDAGIEAHQHPLMMHSEGPKINVCDLAMGQHLITKYGGRRRPGERICPELIVGLLGWRGCPRTRRTPFWVSGHVAQPAELC